MPLYIGDWQKENAVKAMTAEDEGIFLRLIFVCWESERRGYLQLNGKPYPIDLLASTIKTTPILLNQWLTKYQDNFGIFGVEDGIMYSKKHVKLIETSEKRKNAGKQGGNPVLLNHEVNQVSKTGKPITVNVNDNVVDTELVDEIYKLYPSKRPNGSSTGKSPSHKEKILRILKTGTDLKSLVELYILKTEPRIYQHLKTFLNNLPDKDELLKASDLKDQSEKKSPLDLDGKDYRKGL